MIDSMDHCKIIYSIMIEILDYHNRFMIYHLFIDIHRSVRCLITTECNDDSRQNSAFGDQSASGHLSAHIAGVMSSTSGRAGAFGASSKIVVQDL